MNDKLHEIEKLLCDARDLIADLDPDVVDELGLTKTLSNVNTNTNLALVAIHEDADLRGVATISPHLTDAAEHLQVQDGRCGDGSLKKEEDSGACWLICAHPEMHDMRCGQVAVSQTSESPPSCETPK